MLNIKEIRQNPERFDESHKKRGLKLFTDKVISLDEEYRSILTKLQHLQQERNDIAKQFGMNKKQGLDTTELSEKSDHIKAQLHEFELLSKQCKQRLDDILLEQPNLLDDQTPLGKDEDENIVLKTVGEPKVYDFEVKPHDELGVSLDMLDFEQAAHISGSRFVFLKKDLSRLERALSNFFLDVNSKEFGFEEVSPPLLVRDNAALGTAQLPKFKEDLFLTTTNHWLISTGEIPLTNYVADKMLKESELPLRYTASTPCFRSEAGSAGKDTKGMIRLHQFNKVELVSIASEKAAEEEFLHVSNVVETILQRLELPYRVSFLCSGDTGFGAKKTYDYEVWVPSQKTYREISSCSYCGDFQARRMNTRYKPSDGGKNTYVHTFNASGLPTGRTLVAIMENYQQSDGSIKIPHVLVPYMNGQTVIKRG